MLAEERLEKIKEILSLQKNIDIVSLTSMLNISDVTARKDLQKLQQKGFLVKTRGGAVLAESRGKEIKQHLNIENFKQKEFVADLAFRTIDNGESIFLGSGATCYLLARKLKQLKDITVVTNNINALYELVPHVSNVFLVGGEIVYQQGGIMSSSWENVDEYFKGIFVNKAFTSGTGLDLIAGLTVNNVISSFIYKQIPKITRNWTLLIDDAKFNKIGLYQVATMDVVNCVVSNSIDKVYKKAFINQNIKVITA